jgi:hypothetical protein
MTLASYELQHNTTNTQLIKVEYTRPVFPIAEGISLKSIETGALPPAINVVLSFFFLLLIFIMLLHKSCQACWHDG